MSNPFENKSFEQAVKDAEKHEATGANGNTGDEWRGPYRVRYNQHTGEAEEVQLVGTMFVIYRSGHIFGE